MNSERNLNAVSPILFTADGSSTGQITLTSVLGLWVGQKVFVQAPLLPSLEVKVRSIISNTQILVGPNSKGWFNTPIDVSAYTLDAGSFLYANAQPKAVISMEDRLYGSYNQEPINGWTVKPVDSFGNSFDSTNPLPVTVTSNGGAGDITVQYDSNSNPIKYSFYSNAILQKYIVVTYDSNSNPINYQTYNASGVPQ